MVPSLGVALGYGNDDAKVVHRIPGLCMRNFERWIAELNSKEWSAADPMYHAATAPKRTSAWRCFSADYRNTGH